MSTKIKCDKCGVLMKPDFFITRIEIHEEVNGQWFTKIYDLCSDCTKLLKEDWIGE